MQRHSSRHDFEEFRAHLSGQDALDDPSSKRKSKGRQRSTWRLFASFWDLLKGNRGGLGLALIILTLATMLKLVPPAAVKLTIDYALGDKLLPASWIELGIPTEKVPLLFLIGGIAAAVAIVASIAHLWARWNATRTVNRVQVALRKRAFEHAMRLPLHRVYELKSGGAASLLREDAGGAAELVFSMVYNPWRAIVQLVGSLIILLFVDWRLMLGGLAILPIVYLTHRTWIHRIRPLWRNVRQQRQDIDSLTTEAFGGMRVVRAFARERTEAGRFVRGNNLLIRKQLFAWWWTRIIEFIWDAIVPLASAGLLLYGGYRILQEQMTLGDLTMFLFYLAMLLEPLATLVATAAAFQNNLAGLERVLDLLDEPLDMPSQEQAWAPRPADVSGRISLRGVSFQYPGSDQAVLRDIDLEVPAGTTVALVGPSGAGKTTLCNLVARFYDPTEGLLLLDGRDLREIRADSYRRLLGVVEQDVFLFDGTIAENIGYGRRGASHDEILSAARTANAHGFICELEKGYETLIGERGVKLSGGQRQRLAIARAVLADPKLLILDEATSHLDSESERLIQESLHSLLRGRTCFLIAHRLSTASLADMVAVLDKGELIEFGKREELLNRSSTFRKMVDLQFDLESMKGG